MSAASVNSASGGLLLEGDLIALSTDLKVRGSQLHDAATGARHQLHPLAVRALHLLGVQRPAGQWFDRCVVLGMTPAEITEIMLFLNRIGGLERDRRPWPAVVAGGAYLTAWSAGLRPVRFVRRHELRLSSIFASSARVLIPLQLAITATCFLAYGAGVPAWLAAVGWLAGGALMWISLVAHELSHALIIQRLGQPGAILRRPFAVGILHPATPPRTELWLATRPLVGATAGLGAAWLVAASLTQPWLMTVGWLVAGFHLANLLPMYSDGRSAWSAVRRLRS